MVGGGGDDIMSLPNQTLTFAARLPDLGVHLDSRNSNRACTVYALGSSSPAQEQHPDLCQQGAAAVDVLARPFDLDYDHRLL